MSNAAMEWGRGEDGEWDLFDAGQVKEERQFAAEVVRATTGADGRRSRATAALKMRTLNASFDEIAEVLEYSSRSAAQLAVENLIGERVKESDYTSQRVIMNERLEALFQPVYEKAIDAENEDQLAYQGRALSILDRMAKLHGLDAPQRIAVYNPSAAEFDEVVQTLVAKSGHSSDQEADIFEPEETEDAEIVEDEND